MIAYFSCLITCLKLHLVRDDLLGHPRKECPTFIDYTVQAKANSAYNTPNVWGVYIFNLVLKWVRDKGGVEGKYYNNDYNRGCIKIISLYK